MFWPGLSGPPERPEDFRQGLGKQGAVRRARLLQKQAHVTTGPLPGMEFKPMCDLLVIL